MNAPLKLWFGNSHAELHGASQHLLATLATHLSFQVDYDTKLGTRFGGMYQHEGEWYATLMKGNRFASGLVPHVWHLLKHYGHPCDVRDVRAAPEERMPWWSVKAPWRAYQDTVHRLILKRSRGVVDAPPRSGKTLMAARVIDSLAHPTVYLAPSVPIVAQTYKVMVDIFGFDMVARLDGDARTEEKDISKPIVIATAQSAIRQPPEWWATRRMLIIDEFHHAAAETYHQINDLSDHIYYRFCFTGTHFRTGGDRLAMEAICSQVIHRVGIKELIDGKWLAPPRVIYAPVQAPSIASGDWKRIYKKCIVESDVRNEKIAFIAKQLTSQGIPTLVLCRWKYHANLLKDLIPGSEMVQGGESALTSRSIEQFRNGNLLCLVGTTVIGEGVDIPEAAAEIYASSGNAGVQMMQSYFRPLTARPGKEVGYIYDFSDHHHSKLREWARSRMTMAREILGDASVIEL